MTLDSRIQEAKRQIHMALSDHMHHHGIIDDLGRDDNTVANKLYDAFCALNDLQRIRQHGVEAQAVRDMIQTTTKDPKHQCPFIWKGFGLENGQDTRPTFRCNLPEGHVGEHQSIEGAAWNNDPESCNFAWWGELKGSVKPYYICDEVKGHTGDHRSPEGVTHQGPDQCVHIWLGYTGVDRRCTRPKGHSGPHMSEEGHSVL